MLCYLATGLQTKGPTDYGLKHPKPLKLSLYTVYLRYSQVLDREKKGLLVLSFPVIGH
jgi:hypothetical protein